MRTFKKMNLAQKLFAVCFWLITAPYLLYSLFIQCVVYNIAVFLFNMDIKVQLLIVRPYDYFLNKLSAKQ